MPDGVSDMSMLAAYNPIIQKAMNELPRVAARVIEKEGLDVDQFDALQQKMKRNIFFRFRVKKALRRLIDRK